VAGDVYSAANPEQEVAFQVSGAETASLLRGYVSQSSRSGTWDMATHRYEWLIEVVIYEQPGGSGRLILEQLSLPAGRDLPPLTASPWVWFEVGEGPLGLTLEGDELAVGWTAKEERMVRVGSLTLSPPISAGPHMTRRNAGDDPLVLYPMTLTPSDAGTSGAGTPIS
jgi:hypothetical protein